MPENVLFCEQMKQLAHLQHSNTISKSPNNLYHYTEYDIAKRILSSKGIVFRFTDINSFSDVTEGRLIHAYYEIALRNLKEKQIISTQEYEKLIKIRAPEKTLFLFDGNIGSSTYYRMFICCFSTVGQDKYMYENYIKNNSRSGYCLQIPNYILKTKFENREIALNCKYDLSSVIYGNSIVEKIEYYLMEAKKICKEFNYNIIKKAMNALLGNFLLHLKPITKLERYSKENEVRLIVYLPTKNDNTIIYPDYITEIDKDHIEIRFDRKTIGLYPYHVSEKQNDVFIKELQASNYKFSNFVSK